ncbi:hypothetical protein GOP47_0000078 [Adiantum capillus-veneris]|uniref:glucan endo-1,3-beta-D-glucosidase n=1 Tax=Adiantum capillus-veneris TaxID=13818 RepID=A0A9D4VCN0_ADICA|nr:hypothetical protein GOP47_0000078 [Adiantum capillus-veneris]
MLLPQPFPSTNNPAAPELSALLASPLRQAPLPTNTGWLNFILNEGSAPEYIHPYLIQSKDGALSISYPPRVVEANFIYQAFIPDLTMSSRNSANALHNTCRASSHFKQQLHQAQANLAVNEDFKGVVRVALLTSEGDAERVLDKFSSAYPVQGHADLCVPFQVKYEWKKVGWGGLLMLSLPMHRDMMSSPSLDCIESSVVYRSMDGDMYAVAGDSWTLNEMPISVGWYSSKGISDQYCQEAIMSALIKDVAALPKISTDSSYFYGKALARAARLALIAEEVGALDLLRPIRDFLADSMTPWMEGSLTANALLYDEKWGGLTTQNGSVNPGADFGFGVYNDHHYHLGYFCYAGAVLTKLDPTWGCTYKAHLYTIVEDFMTSHHHHVERPKHTGNWLSQGPFHHRHTKAARSKALFPRFRNFDFWVLHSWAGGLTEFADGRNQESTSEAVNAYYSAALLGLAFGDSHLMNTGLTLSALEIRAARALWHVPSDSTLYEQGFVTTQRIVGVLWANKRDTGLWFAPSEWRECRLGIQLLPILPITEVLFQDIKYVQELVQWALPALSRDGVGQGWKGFVYALQAMYAPEEALHNVLSLSEHDDGNSLSNLLWWIYTRWSW